MTKTVQHTPPNSFRLPWSVYRAPDNCAYPVIKGRDQFCIATVWHERSAVLIVDRINGHDAIAARVAELETALRGLLNVTRDSAQGNALRSEAIKRARAALANVQS